MKTRRTGGLSVLRTVGAVVLASSSLGFGFACVDPKGDYGDYIERTNTMRGGNQVDATPFETGEVDTDAGKATFFVSCLPKTFSGAPEVSILLYMEANISGGKLSFTNFPMKDDATKFAKSETLGSPHGATDVPISGENTFSAPIPGNPIIPGKSQRITDNDLELADVVFEGRILSNDRWCAELNGNVTKPTPQKLTEPGDFCVMVRLNEGDDLPRFSDSSGRSYVGFAADQYHCP